MPTTSIADIRKQYPQYDDMSDEQLAKALHQKFYSDMEYADFSQRIGLAQPEQPKQPERSNLQELGRQLELAGRYIVEGGLSLPAMAAQPLADIADMALEKVGSDFRFGNQAQNVSNLLTEAGVAEPETATERVVGDASRALAAGGAVTGVAQRVAGPVAQQVAARPGLQAVGEVAGGGAGGAARESGAGPGGQFAAALAGGIAAPLAVQATANAARRVAAPAGRLASSGADNLGQLRGRRTDGLIEEYGGEAVTPEATKRLRSAQRMGAQITPAEATGDPILAARQGSLGTSDRGARELVEFSNARATQQRQAIDSLLDDLSPSGASAAADIRATAQRILKQQQDALSAQAAPIYKRAFESSIDDATARVLLENPVIAKAAKAVRQSPLYRQEIGEIAGKSDAISFRSGISPQKVGLRQGLKGVRFWDLVKRHLDDEIQKSVQSGERNQSRLLQNPRNQIVEALDAVSPDYAAARAIYGEGARPLQALREGAVGRIASLADDKLKSVSKILFDPNETNPKVLNQLRQQFLNEDPGAWRRIIRNEMERRLDAAKAGRTGSSFYNSILAKDRDFAMFMNATRGMPDIQRTLIDMRRIWQDVINPESVKGAAGKAKSSLDVPRSTMEAGINWMKNALGGRADTAAVRFITDPEWADDVARIARIKDPNKRRAEIVSALQAVSETTPAQSAALTATVSEPGSDEYQQ